MKQTLKHAAVLGILTGALAACGGDDDPPPAANPPSGTTPAPSPAPAPAPAPGPAPAPAARVGDTVALTATGKLVSFDRATPASPIGSVVVNGLPGGETLLGIDFRPADGRLYAISSAGRLYTLDPATGVATAKASLAADAADASAPFTALAGNRFGVDFNPVADRLRVVSDTGQNLRINVDSGATTTDGALARAGGAPVVTAAAYTNAFAGTATTQLFDLDPAAGLLHLQDPPNDGTLAAGLPLGVSADGADGFDIDARDNVAYAALTVGGTTSLFTVDLATGAASPVGGGAIAGGEPVIGLALVPSTAPTVIGLAADNRLLAFDPAAPNVIASTVAIAGLAAGEKVVGIDVRPANGRLYALTDGARLFTVDAATGAATAPVALVAAAGATGASGQPFAALAGSQYSVDFNPVADRLRVVSDTGLNLRIDVDTGATLRDGDIGRTPAATVVAAAYTNSGVGAVRPAATALYDIDTVGDVLSLQAANPGTLTDIGPLGVDVGASAGFDIGGGANGWALAAIRPTGTQGPSLLYAVSLVTGAATPYRNLSADAIRIGGADGVPLIDLAIRF